VRHSECKHSACDLHALGTPPAFVLSQDQTLHYLAFPIEIDRVTAQSSYYHGKVQTQGPGK
jgi:hypothetical protein